MKKLITILAIISLILILVISIEVKAMLYKLNNCFTEYEYIDVNGNTGSSKHCFNVDGSMICRDIKTAKKVVKIENKEVCK